MTLRGNKTGFHCFVELTNKQRIIVLGKSHYVCLQFVFVMTLKLVSLFS